MEDSGAVDSEDRQSSNIDEKMANNEDFRNDKYSEAKSGELCCFRSYTLKRGTLVIAITEAVIAAVYLMNCLRIIAKSDSGASMFTVSGIVAFAGVGLVIPLLICGLKFDRQQLVLPYLVWSVITIGISLVWVLIALLHWNKEDFSNPEEELIPATIEFAFHSLLVLFMLIWAAFKIWGLTVAIRYYRLGKGKQILP